jgi:hypothetical protein
MIGPLPYQLFRLIELKKVIAGRVLEAGKTAMGEQLEVEIDLPQAESSRAWTSHF